MHLLFFTFNYGVVQSPWAFMFGGAIFPHFCVRIWKCGNVRNCQDLRDAFYTFGELRSIRIVPGKDFAFVQFTTREAAEAAAEQLYKVTR